MAADGAGAPVDGEPGRRGEEDDGESADPGELPPTRVHAERERRLGGVDAVHALRVEAEDVVAGGEAGVARVIDILRTELERNMMLMGLQSIDQITSECIRWRDPRFIR